MHNGIIEWILPSNKLTVYTLRILLLIHNFYVSNYILHVAVAAHIVMYQIHSNVQYYSSVKVLIIYVFVNNFRVTNITIDEVDQPLISEVVEVSIAKLI